MIAPDMATMLAFIFTDAAIPANVLQQLLTNTNASSFNCITVDGDTSTSDTALAFATGKAGNEPPKSISDAEFSAFCNAFESLMQELAHAIIRDGEGAQKFVTIKVSGAESVKAARTIGLSIANSPLVKTALAAGDANWGRIVAAVGKAGEKADRDKLAITIGGVSVAKHGEADPAYVEATIDAHMKSQNIDITVDVGIGSSECTVWTCDLTHGYIDINGSYRS
jgi:glutamate N-acetyltransferase/amino-acid N-acetyltransferase